MYHYVAIAMIVLQTFAAVTRYERSSDCQFLGTHTYPPLH